jgi:hypothetical protein
MQKRKDNGQAAGGDMRTAYEWLRANCEIEMENDCAGCALLRDGKCPCDSAPANWPELR